MRILSKPRKPSVLKPKRLLRGRATGQRQAVPARGYSLAQMVEDLRNYQAELEIQNKALRYSQIAAEGASERFLTLFSNVPLALLVVDENGLVLERNAMALRLFRPLESDPPLNFLLPLVNSEYLDKVAQAFVSAKKVGTNETTEVVFSSGSSGVFTGDFIELLRETRLIRPDLPVALASGYVTAEIEQSALSAGARALIHKPNDVDELCETVQRLLQSVDAH